VPETKATPKDKKPSKNARKSAARLVASQLVYEYFLTKTPLAELVSDYQYVRVNTPIDEEGEDALIAADVVMLKHILDTVALHEKVLTDLVEGQRTNKAKEPEKLLEAIMLCAAAELFTSADQGIDKPIIINDYLHVTRAFFDDNEVRFVNGTLDAVTKLLS
jgi:N utilization substance protein B